MLHFLERDSKPFEPKTHSTGQEFDVWSGLKGLEIPDVTDSKYTRQLCFVTSYLPESVSKLIIHHIINVL